MSKGVVHQVAAGGFGTGTNDLYDRARPTYPAAALQAIHDSLPTSSPLTILEPGSGTGIFTRLVLSPPEKYPTFDVKTLIGIEPSAGMREAFQKGIDKLPEQAIQGKKVESVDGTFDDFSKAGLGKGEADAVIIAQAFHWCPDYEGALREVASYLKPGQPLILIWNLEDKQADFPLKVTSFFEPYNLGTPQYFKGLWRKMFDTAAYNELFDTQVETKHPWSVGVTEDSLVQTITSKSYLTEQHLKGEERVKFERELRDVIRNSKKTWIDEKNGVFEYKYNTDVVVCRRKE